MTPTLGSAWSWNRGSYLSSLSFTSVLLAPTSKSIGVSLLPGLLHSWATNLAESGKAPSNLQKNLP